MPRFEPRAANQERISGSNATPPAIGAMLGTVDAHPEASYVCPACGEEIVVPIDPSAGARQEYVEDCPVCCRPIQLEATLERDGSAWLRAELE